MCALTWLTGCGGDVRHGSYFHAPPLGVKETRAAAATVDLSKVRYYWITPAGVRTYGDEHVVVDLLVVLQEVGIGTPEDAAQFHTNGIHMARTRWHSPREARIGIRTPDGKAVHATRAFSEEGPTPADFSQFGLVQGHESNPVFPVHQGDYHLTASIVPVFLVADQPMVVGESVTIQLSAGEIQGDTVDESPHTFRMNQVSRPRD